MKKFVVIGLLAFFIKTSYGQDSIPEKKKFVYLEIGFGATHLSEPDIMSQNKQLGYSADLGIKIEHKSQKLAITPMLGIKEYKADVENEDYENVMGVFRIGAIVDFTLYNNKTKTLFIYNSFKVCYAHYRNYLRIEDGTIPSYGPNGPQQSKDYDTQTLFMADAPSLTIGGKIKYKYFYAEAGYNISKGRITYDKFVKKSLQNNDAAIEMRPKITFNSLDIQVGMSLPFGK